MVDKMAQEKAEQMVEQWDKSRADKWVDGRDDWMAE